MTSWTREALTHETMVRQGLSSRRPVGVTDAVRSVLALQAQEPAAPYLALWNRIDDFDPSDLDRALADGAIVKASLFRFTLHAVDANDIPWARPPCRVARDAGYHGILDDAGLTAERFDEPRERLSTVMAEPHDNTAIERVLSSSFPRAATPPDSGRRCAPSAPLRHARRPAPGRSAVGRPSCPARLQPMTNQPQLQNSCVATSRPSGPATVADMSQFTILKRSTLRKSSSRWPTSSPFRAGPDRGSSM
ncbi:MAG: winged helix DNA-binding domain-containing protein [Acidimicrobiaceae bacterium]|nr:winged helix DNA-binding domain-containing protein [Acidimicrobiaceae bacterium]